MLKGCLFVVTCLVPSSIMAAIIISGWFLFAYIILMPIWTGLFLHVFLPKYESEPMADA